MTAPQERRRPGVRAIPFHETREEVKFVHRLQCAIKVWWLMLAFPALCIVIPTTFAAGDDDSLRMSDDFAAMTSAALALLLTLGFLEMERAVRGTRARTDAQFAAAESGVVISETSEIFDDGTKRRIALGAAAVALWLLATLLMGIALILIFLWAAIDGHGPARWLAWYVLYSVCLGLGGLLMTTVAKAMTDLDALASTYKKGIIKHLVRRTRPESSN